MKRWFIGADGEAALRLHWQNLNEDHIGRAKGPPWHGRAWLHVRNECFALEWNLRSRSCGVGFSTDRGGESTWAWKAAFPPVALYGHMEPRKGRLLRRLADWISAKSSDMGSSWSGSRTGIDVFDNAIWWKVFADDSGWCGQRPRWRDGSWRPLDTFLGREVYASHELGRHDVLVPMPERAYRGTVILSEDTWKRPHWVTRRRYGAHVEMQEPIPIPGKGENSWDCGDDAIHGLSTTAETVEDAVAAVVRSALRDRRRHGGPKWHPKEDAA